MLMSKKITKPKNNKIGGVISVSSINKFDLIFEDTAKLIENKKKIRGLGL